MYYNSQCVGKNKLPVQASKGFTKTMSFIIRQYIVQHALEFFASINNTADTKKTIHLVFQKELLIYYSNLSERGYTVFGKKKKKNKF